MSTQVTVTKQEWTKDENGNQMYDNEAIAAFRQKIIKQAEKQNVKIKTNPSRYRQQSIITNLEQYADFQVRMNLHNFRKFTSIVINKY